MAISTQEIKLLGGTFAYVAIGRLYTSRSCFATLTPFTTRHPADVIKVSANMLSLDTSANS